MNKHSKSRSNSKSKDNNADKPAVRLISAESLLLQLYEKAQISENELKAGLRYVHDFLTSGLQGHYAKVHYDIVGINSLPAHANDNFSPGELQIAARQRIKHTEKRLGHLAASCFYHVLGLGISLRDYAHRISRAGYQGHKRLISPSQAKAILLSGLSCLAD
ncbi:MAG: hypothetical protein EYC62_02575 [Alphaproteobacteria bacterium]|nr:MAG: hypothetical protein EYC62_02575 [Alphaproteobacteria bacterium]